MQEKNSLLISQEIVEKILQFRDRRKWEQFHNPKDLAISLSLEAAELLECFQWSGEADKERVAEEASDVLAYLLQLFDKMGIDPVEAFQKKMQKNREKYPPELARGSALKYDRLKKS